MPAFELIDDRSADYSNLAAQLLSGIADNGWNAGVVLGSPLTEWRNIDLAEVRGRLQINDAIAGDGQGKDVMGHPFEALTWFINRLAMRGKSLKQGAIIMTGSIVATKFVNAGDTLRFVAGELGEVSLRVE